jgi:hypothetical protein
VASEAGLTTSYCFGKDGDQNIAASTLTVLTPWTIATLDIYHTIDGWNLVTGEYTASIIQVLSVNVNLTWSGGISNLGSRILRVQHLKFGEVIWITIKEVSTQADPNKDIETTQDCQVNAKINAGDKLRITVEHNAPVELTISQKSSLSGLRINI